MTQIEKIKAEIERLDEEQRKLRICGTNQQAKEADLVNHTLQGLSNFIHSLEQEQAQGLDEAAEEYREFRTRGYNKDAFDDAILFPIDLNLAFKAGVKWMAEQGNDNLPKVHGWVASLKNGDLGLSTDKPYFRVVDEEKIICCDNGLIINNSLFPELKWEDEPIEVELTIQKV